VESLDEVQWIGIYQPSYRISPALSSAISNAAGGSVVTQEGSVGGEAVYEDIIILLFDANDNERVLSGIEKLGGEIVDNAGDIMRVRIYGGKIPDIAIMNGVSWIEKYVQPVVFNDIAANITNVYDVRNTHGLTGSGQIVAVADTGLDTGVNDESMHDDIEGRIVSLIDLSDDGAADIFGGHGTHVAGSVLGNGTLSGGQFKGMAPEAQLVFQAVEDADGSLGGIPLNLTTLFQQAYDQGARIHTNSWGYDGYYGDYLPYSRETDIFMWEHPYMLILFSAGNEGVDGNSDGVIDSGSITPPATAKNCLSIGATENNRPSISYIYSTFLAGGTTNFPAEPIKSDKLADNIEGIAAFSSRAPTDDGRIKPDVVAPGTFIISTR
jgi:subtilisin family serine protease